MQSVWCFVESWALGMQEFLQHPSWPFVAYFSAGLAAFLALVIMILLFPPLSRWLEKFGLQRWMASLLALFVLLGFVFSVSKYEKAELARREGVLTVPTPQAPSEQASPPQEEPVSPPQAKPASTEPWIEVWFYCRHGNCGVAPTRFDAYWGVRNLTAFPLQDLKVDYDVSLMNEAKEREFLRNSLIVSLDPGGVRSNSSSYFDYGKRFSLGPWTQPQVRIVSVTPPNGEPVPFRFLGFCNEEGKSCSDTVPLDNY